MPTMLSLTGNLKEGKPDVDIESGQFLHGPLEGAEVGADVRRPPGIQTQQGGRVVTARLEQGMEGFLKI